MTRRDMLACCSRIMAVMLLGFLLAAVWPTAAPAQSGVIYVDADIIGGAGDGSSWDNAFKDLQSALNAATSSDRIWVAKGTYKPSVKVGGTGPRYAAFQMKTGVGIYGGFAGTENPATFNLANRNFVANETILSGDIGVVENSSDNCYHVFNHPTTLALNSTAVLDGFTIRGGYASGGGTDSYGGGMYNGLSSPTLTNCAFSGNSASYGGGIYNSGSSPTLSYCTFSGNSADYGGGIDNGGSSPTLSYCIFSGNSADYGGGIYDWDSSHPTLTHCSLSGNSADYGGGMYNDDSSPTLTNCTVSGNAASQYGGGMYNNASSPTLANCAFSENSASAGGGMYNRSYVVYNPDGKFLSSPKLTNCTFSKNSAQDGSGMYNDGSSPEVTHCTFSGNSASGKGGGIYNLGTSEGLAAAVKLSNSILWGNIDTFANAQIVHILPLALPVSQVSYSAIQYSGGSGVSWDTTLGTDLGGNIDADPFFVDAASGDVHLQAGSPCIDAGDNTVSGLPATDFEGDARRIDDPGTYDTGCGTPPIADMGADEYTGISNLATVVVSIALQGSSRPTTTGWQVPATVKFYEPGTSNVKHAFSGTTSKSGSVALLQVPNIRPGTYDVTIVSAHTLLNIRRSKVVSLPSISLNMGTLLEGNANGDNIIDIADFTLLAASFMKMKGDAGFNALTDFDRNDIVDMLDFTLLAGNFMKMNPVVVP